MPVYDELGNVVGWEDAPTSDQPYEGGAWGETPVPQPPNQPYEGGAWGETPVPRPPPWAPWMQPDPQPPSPTAPAMTTGDPWSSQTNPDHEQRDPATNNPWAPYVDRNANGSPDAYVGTGGYFPPMPGAPRPGVQIPSLNPGGGGGAVTQPRTGPGGIAAYLPQVQPSAPRGGGGGGGGGGWNWSKEESISPQAQFEEDARRYGMDYALRQAQQNIGQEEFKLQFGEGGRQFDLRQALAERTQNQARDEFAARHGLDQQRYGLEQQRYGLEQQQFGEGTRQFDLRQALADRTQNQARDEFAARHGLDQQRYGLEQQQFGEGGRQFDLRQALAERTQNQARDEFAQRFGLDTRVADQGYGLAERRLTNDVDTRAQQAAFAEKQLTQTKELTDADREARKEAAAYAVFGRRFGPQASLGN